MSRAERVSGGVPLKESGPSFRVSRSALASAITLTIAGVPASNLSGAFAQITQSGATSLAVPPPVSVGALLLSARRSTANARSPSGRPTSSLDTARKVPGASSASSTLALRGVQKTTAVVCGSEPRCSSTMSRACSYRRVETSELCPLPRCTFE